MHKELKYNTNKRKCKIYSDLQVNILQIVFYLRFWRTQNTLVVINIC